MKYEKYQTDYKVIYYTEEYSGIELLINKHNNNLHSIYDEPAVIAFGIDGRMLYKNWYKNGYIHRDNNYACIYYDAAGEIIELKSYNAGKLYSYNKPAHILYSNKVITEYAFYENDKLHNFNGVALYKNSKIKRGNGEFYFIHGRMHTEEEYKKIMFKLKLELL